ncbi:YheC/YheD family endospore coat-associated protein [Alkalihalobacterium elongatum]|uniref:YheC/YheD family endospore coat-associated protein n=1 Tax=Alkalihalobacterium elongatum TaxID=2675466 RepID=UPI001C1FCA1B|nr:YheC/YheD family protein [Alkalihalobacterium elongatum]
MYISWVPTKEVDVMYLPEQLKNEIKFSNSKITFHFGSWNKEVSIEYKEDLPSNTIGLSHNLQLDVFIPDDLFYDVITTENSISIGPVILYLVSKNLYKRLDLLFKRIKNNVSLNGLIIVSTVSRIDTHNRKIKGYYFKPKTESKLATWKSGIFQYPGAIFKRVSVPISINEHLIQMTKGGVFNSRFFNKWDIWEWLSPNTLIRNHLPDTQEFNTIDQINSMLEIYSSVYLKPIKGSQGKGIIQVKRYENVFQVIDDKNRVSTITDLKQHSLIKKVLKSKKRYMIQQGVPIEHHSRNVDFRMYVQKDATKKWKCSGLIARFGKPGSITTNLHHLDYLLQGKQAFEKIFGLNGEEAKLLEKKVVTICIKACELLDEHGCYGDIAIDFIIDKEQHVWILEMNKRYGYKSFSIMEDQPLYGEIIQNPFLYASALAGFGVQNETKNEKPITKELDVESLDVQEHHNDEKQSEPVSLKAEHPLVE